MRRSHPVAARAAPVSRGTPLEAGGQIGALESAELSWLNETSTDRAPAVRTEEELPEALATSALLLAEIAPSSLSSPLLLTLAREGLVT